MEVTADLRFEVDGIVSTVTGDGSNLVVHSTDPAAVLSALVRSSLPSSVGRLDGPRALGRAADGLELQGLRVELTGPDGVYLTLGRDARSRVGQMVTRSSHVQPGRAAALRPLIGAKLVRRGRRSAGVAVLGAAAVAVVWRVARRRTTGS